MLLIAATTLAPVLFAADGATLYKSKCVMCHGPDGAGQTSMGKSLKLRDLGSPAVQKQTDKELHAWTADGKGKMPAYKGKLSESDIQALVAFMRTFKK
ncbi:MAG: cytochrome c [Acidobacteriota bacterium]